MVTFVSFYNPVCVKYFGSYWIPASAGMTAKIVNPESIMRLKR